MSGTVPLADNILPLDRARHGDASRCEEIRLPLLERARLHEIHARGGDWAAAMGFALAMRGLSGKGQGAQGKEEAVFLIRGGHSRRWPLEVCGDGLAGLGADVGRLVIVQTGGALDLLRAGLEAARCPGVAAVVLETWGRLVEYDLTASRRLVLAAERSRVAVIVLRGDAPLRPSAAHTRWSIGSAPSVPLAAQAPGPPAMEVELLRRRGGPAGLRWRLEWDEEHGAFREAPPAGAREAALPGAVVSVSRLRAGEEGRGPGHSFGSRADAA